MFNAFCTTAVFTEADSLMRTKKVPMMEKIIPVPAISIGNKIGEKPMYPSIRAFLLASVTS